MMMISLTMTPSAFCAIVLDCFLHNLSLRLSQFKTGGQFKFGDKNSVRTPQGNVFGFEMSFGMNETCC